MDVPHKIVLASGNPGKAREIRELLADRAIEVVLQTELGVTEIEETGLSFVENALLKARNAARHSGLPALADDSGLVVEQLGGRPGIYSSRYAGPDASDRDNLVRLLEDLDGTPEAARGARFHCAMVLVRHAEDPVPVICEGSWRGRIGEEPRGRSGFGYDPVFVTATGRTAAELDPEEKNRLSHRGQALRKLLRVLDGLD